MNPSGAYRYISLVGDQLRVQAEGVIEAKLALKELKLKKKELALARKEILQEQRQLRAAYTDQTRQQGPAMRGGGFFGRLMRASQQDSRHAAKQQLAKALAPLENRRNNMDALIQAVEEAMLQVEQYIARDGE